MLFTIKRQDLSAFTSRMQSIINNKIKGHTEPDTFIIKASSDSNNIIMSAENNSSYLQYTIYSPVDLSGSIKLSPITFMDSVKVMQNDVLTIQLSKDRASISIIKPNATCSIPCSEVNEKEANNEMDKLFTISINSENLSLILRKTSYLTSKDCHIPSLRGIRLKVDTENQNINLCASDGKRLGTYTTKAKISSITSETSGEYVVPVKFMEDVEKYISSLSSFSDVEIIIYPNHIEAKINYSNFGGGDMLMKSSLIDSTYPNIDQIITSTNKSPAISSINRQELINAIKIAQAFTSDKHSSIRIFVCEDQIRITASSVSGTGETTLKAKCKNHPCNVIGFNCSCLISMLKSETGEIISMNINNPTSPCRISPENTDEKIQGISILMPTRLI